LYELRRQTNTDLINQVDEANKLIKDIAEYNKAIAISKDPSGHDCLTFIDQREVAIEKLSKLANVTVSYEPNGLANVFVNAINVVTGPSYETLRVVEYNNEITGESTLSVVSYNERKDLTTIINPTGGQMAAALKQYNILLDPVEQSGFSIMQTLDSFVNAVATAVNDLFSTGYGLNDMGDDPPGRVLFESASGEPITAGNIKISDGVRNAADIPLSSASNSPGNSVIAQEVSRLLQSQKFLNDQTPMEFYSNFIGKISQNASEAVMGKNSSKLVNESLNTTRDSIMGVNIEEEAISMVKFQKYLEAASKIVETNNLILGIIINLGR
jgi:flagellar hook-associated protein 1 FlgK